MKTIFNKYFVFALTVIVLLVGTITSCKKKQNQYVKELSEIAKSFNEHCPKEQGNGYCLEAVTFADSTLSFRLTTTDNAISKFNTDVARDSIVNNVSAKLKKFLVKGNCNLEYKYVAPNDSITITIEPKEMEKGVQ